MLTYVLINFELMDPHIIYKIQIVKDNYIIGVPQHVGAKWKDIGWGVQAPPVRSATTRDGHGRECDGDGKCLSSTKGERLQFPGASRIPRAADLAKFAREDVIGSRVVPLILLFAFLINLFSSPVFVFINLVSSQATSRTKTCIIKLCENHLARETLNFAVWLRVHSQPMPISFINYVHISKKKKKR